MPDIVDQKLIREEFEFFGRYQDQCWKPCAPLPLNSIKSSKTWRASSIQPEERPEVGPPPPEIAQVEPRKISAAEAKKAQIKRAYNDARKEQQFDARANAIHAKVHGLSQQGAGSRRGARKRTR